jgi:tRNA-dihydrouridine synthase
MTQTQTKLYFAPLEGVTDRYFRAIHASLFADCAPDAYFAPFFTPTADTPITARDRAAVLPENNHGYTLIPQIMANDADMFLLGARALYDMGYREVNINLGCPSGTVTSRGRGSGFLADPDALDRFFDGVFSDILFSPHGGGMTLSVKTRLGIFNADEFYDILPVYNRYPITELILHPRVRKEMYRGDVHTDMTVWTAQNSPLPLCINGDLFTAGDVKDVFDALGSIPHAVMLGRGAVSNPQLFAQVRALIAGEVIPPTDKERIYRFYLALCEDARTRLSGERHTLFRMKELFAYWIVLFADAESHRRRLRKANTLAEFRAAAESLFSECDLYPDAGFIRNAKMNG